MKTFARMVLDNRMIVELYDTEDIANDYIHKNLSQIPINSVIGIIVQENFVKEIEGENVRFITVVQASSLNSGNYHYCSYDKTGYFIRKSFNNISDAMFYARHTKDQVYSIITHGCRAIDISEDFQQYTQNILWGIAYERQF